MYSSSHLLILNQNQCDTKGKKNLIGGGLVESQTRMTLGSFVRSRWIIIIIIIIIIKNCKLYITISLYDTNL